MTTIKENAATTLATYSYDTAGRRASITLGNGTVTSYSYHPENSLKTLSHNVNAAAYDVDWTYGYNRANQQISKVMGGGTNLGFYQWEPVSNRTDAYAANGLNQYTTVAGSAISYDLNGVNGGDKLVH